MERQDLAARAAADDAQLDRHGALDEPNDDGSFDYAGETKIWWDEQRTIRDKKGRVLLICEDAHEWYSKMEGGE